MPRDVSTRWNSTFDMLHFSLKYRPAIDAMTAMRDLDLRKYELTPEEWGIAKELRVILEVYFCACFPFHLSSLTSFPKIFKDATLFFSRGTPNLATVIPAMDHIDKVLATKSDSARFSLPICTALAIGKNTVNRYYNKTDHSEVYRITMSKYFPLFFNFFPNVHVVGQFFTRVTNSHTSRLKIGKKIGSRLLATLSARSSIDLIPL